MKKQNEIREIKIPSKAGTLEGFLSIPQESKGIVIFAHGSGSGRFSPRNQFVAKVLNEAHLGTLLMDLLTPSEEKIDDQTGHLRFDIPLLAERLEEAADYLIKQKETKGLSIGYFGASTGAAAALVAASRQGPEKIKAVVSRGGRPDLAGTALSRVRSPTLLIVGGLDFTVIELNQQAYELLPSEKRLEIVPGATHLFEEHGCLEEVARLSTHWFKRFL